MARLGDVLVLGLGRSGVASARYLAARLGEEVASVTVVDAGETPALRALAEELTGLGATVVLGAENVTGRYELGVASPGIPPHSGLMRSASECCERLVSELEFAFSESDRPWVAITGTNGKTTTTSLVAHLLRCAGMDALAVGNIGSPAIAAVEAADAGAVFVAEVSSFQLALTRTFRPRVAVLLNLTPDHIDWHGSLEAYAQDKARIFANLAEGDTAIIDADDPGSSRYLAVAGGGGAEVVPVSLSSRSVPGATMIDGELILETRSGALRLGSLASLRLRGEHNASNALAAAAVAHAMGVSAGDIREGLRSFEPIAHRLQPVGDVRGVEYVNDSKATNPDAVFKALAAYSDRPVLLLLGGRNKGNDFRPLAETTSRTAKAVVAFGEARVEIEAAFHGLDIPVAGAAHLRDALLAAADLAEPGDVILLSPACASFDEFENFEHRGAAFSDAVAGMMAGDGA